MQHFYQNVPGFFNESHEQLFNQIMDNSPDHGVWVEIGAFLGKSISYAVCQSLLRQKYYSFHTIDLWKPHMETAGFYQQFNVDENKLYEIFLKNINPIKNRVRYYKKSSVETATLFEDKSVDIIYIDGRHSYSSVTDDIKAWYPKMKESGVMGFDDYLNPNFEGCKKAIDEFVKEHNLELTLCGWTCYTKLYAK